jgi:formylmethanofuran dehydrogenase subunit E
VRVKDGGELIYMTYYMVDWTKVKQEPSDVRCADCGEPMNLAEPAVDAKGQKYDCYVCHKDRRVVWVRSR